MNFLLVVILTETPLKFTAQREIPTKASYVYSETNDLPSSSTIVIVVLLGLPRLTSLGNDFRIMKTLKFSFLSSTSSSVIEILNEVVICRAGIVTLYNPLEL